MMSDNEAQGRVTSLISETVTKGLDPSVEMKDSGVEWIGEIPMEWGVVHLRYACRFEYGEGLSSEGRVPGEVKVYGSNGAVGEHETSNTLAPALIIGRKGSFGKVSYTSEPVFAIDTTFFVDQRHTKTHLKWLYHCLSSIGLDDLSVDTGVPGLSREDTYSRSIPLPPVPEQQTIADYLDQETARIDLTISKKQTLIELLDERRASLISETVTKGLDPSVEMKDSGVEWIGEIPEGWGAVRLGMSCRVAVSNVDKKTRDDEREVWLCNYTDVYYNEFINASGSFMRASATSEQICAFSLRIGDVLITKDSETPDDIGIAAIVSTAADGLLCGYHLAIIRPGSQFSSHYLFRYVTAAPARNQFTVAANGITRFGLRTEAIKNLWIPLPSLPEQQAIADYLDQETARIDKIKDLTKRQIELLKEHRQSLISAVVTGKIRVPGRVA